MWPKMTVDQENCDDFQNDDLNDSNNTLTSKKNPDYQDDKSPTRMFGDTIQYRNSKQMNRETRTDKLPKPGLPPTLPAPVVPAYNKAISSSQSFSSANEQRMPENIRKPGAATINFSKPVNIIAIIFDCSIAITMYLIIIVCNESKSFP